MRRGVIKDAVKSKHEIYSINLYANQYEDRCVVWAAYPENVLAQIFHFDVKIDQMPLLPSGMLDRVFSLFFAFCYSVSHSII